MPRLIRALIAAAITAGAVAASAPAVSGAVAHDTWTHPPAHAVADTWTSQPGAVSWG